MDSTDEKSSPSLRALTEARLAEDLLHELQALQVELEMQNEALRQAQTALEESRDRATATAKMLESVIEAIPFAVFVKDAESRLVLMNKACELQWGMRFADLQGTNCSQLFPPDQMAHFLAMDKRAFERGQPFDIEETIWSAPLQQNRMGQTFKSPCFDSDGKPLYLTCAVIDITERKQAEDALRKTTGQLQKLSRRVLEVQEIERRRLAIELHDELGQALTAIKINLHAQDHFTGRSPAEINVENIGIVEAALQQIRRLALALRPSMLDDIGLIPALRWIAEQTETRGDLVVQFHADKFQSRLTPEIEIVCFRIAQEALTNILRHTQARFVEIDLRLDGDTLVLFVRDDGCGFDPFAVRERALAGDSMGILGMEERAALINGQLDIQSEPGQGSRVRLSCPLLLRGEAT